MLLTPPLPSLSQRQILITLMSGPNESDVLPPRLQRMPTTKLTPRLRSVAAGEVVVDGESVADSEANCSHELQHLYYSYIKINIVIQTYVQFIIMIHRSNVQRQFSCNCAVQGHLFKFYSRTFIQFPSGLPSGSLGGDSYRSGSFLFMGWFLRISGSAGQKKKGAAGEFFLDFAVFAKILQGNWDFLCSLCFGRLNYDYINLIMYTFDSHLIEPRMLS